MGDKAIITPSNSVVTDFKELENVAVKTNNGTAVFVRDLATVANGADVTTGYALINGKRSVYIPVTKRADVSTWDVVQSIKKALPDMQAAIPDDIKVSYEFDQSGYVINSLNSLLFESLLGALLTGLMVGLFLKDIRSAVVVVINIPLSLLTLRLISTSVPDRANDQYYDLRRPRAGSRYPGGRIHRHDGKYSSSFRNG